MESSGTGFKVSQKLMEAGFKRGMVLMYLQHSIGKEAV